MVFLLYDSNPNVIRKIKIKRTNKKIKKILNIKTREVHKRKQKRRKQKRRDKNNDCNFV
tara:strand:- start:303 stop:479 length:177 start_codon:yes stop_codon:yes gene_type:complete